MKPTKNKIYCKDCGKSKMLFETQKKADTFIKFNSAEILEETGYAPKRSYYCIYCNGWHVTSSSEVLDIKSKTEIILDLYSSQKKRRQEKRNKEIKKRDELINNIESQIKAIREIRKYIEPVALKEMLKRAIIDFGEVKQIMGCQKRKIEIDNKLQKLITELNFIDL